MSELPKREPQQSEEARRDRAMSWSGQIVPPVRPCTDLDLMARLLTALRNLDPPEEDST